MANAYKCDRCGVFFEEYKSMNEYPLVAKEWVYGGNLFYHLCEKCHEDLKLFMQNYSIVGPNEAKKPMTCRERLAIEHPGYIGEKWIGGCYQCPHDYGYAGQPTYCYGGGRCVECWDRPVEERK